MLHVAGSGGRSWGMASSTFGRFPCFTATAGVSPGLLLLVRGCLPLCCGVHVVCRRVSGESWVNVRQCSSFSLVLQVLFYACDAMGTCDGYHDHRARVWRSKRCCSLSASNPPLAMCAMCASVAETDSNTGHTVLYNARERSMVNSQRSYSPPSFFFLHHRHAGSVLRSRADGMLCNRVTLGVHAHCAAIRTANNNTSWRDARVLAIRARRRCPKRDSEGEGHTPLRSTR